MVLLAAILKMASKFILMFGAKEIIQKTNNTVATKLEEKPKMKTSQKGKDLLAELEGLKLSPYLDSIKVPTIGIGNTFYEDGRKVTMQDPPITKERAYQLLDNVLKKFEEGINSLVKVPLTQNQFDALICFSYNVGLGNFQKSTLLKFINVKNFEQAPGEFIKWTKAGGQVLPGLVTRRTKERALFTTV